MPDINPSTCLGELFPKAIDYMPLEAKASPPPCLNQLDWFYYAVLTLQIVTRKVPKPKDIPVPETERRKDDIALMPIGCPLATIVNFIISNRIANDEEVLRILSCLKMEANKQPQV